MNEAIHHYIYKLLNCNFLDPASARLPPRDAGQMEAGGSGLVDAPRVKDGLYALSSCLGQQLAVAGDEHRIDDEASRAQLVLAEQLEQYPMVVSSRTQVATQRRINDS